MDLFDYQDYDNVDETNLTTDYTETDDIDISKGLNQLTLDERVRLAERGEKSDLDILVDDPDYRVRELVATHGYAGHLNQLVLDPHPVVRGEVAGLGKTKYLKQLQNDPDPNLNDYVNAQLEK